MNSFFNITRYNNNPAKKTIPHFLEINLKLQTTDVKHKFNSLDYLHIQYTQKKKTKKKYPNKYI